MASRIISLFGITLLAIALFAVPIVAPEDNLIPLQGTVSGGTPTNLTVAIYDAPTAGNEVYNSTTDFGTAINSSNGAFDVILGNGTNFLSLNYGTNYYMEMIIDGEELDFNGSERQVFQSNVGNLSVSTPIDTSSTITTTSTADDALNATGGLTLAAGGFNVSENATLNTNGSLLVNLGASNIVRISNGGASVPVFNVSSGTSHFEANGPTPSAVFLGEVEFNNIGEALNVTSGTAWFENNVMIVNSDSDGALNVSAGGAYIGGILTMGGNLDVLGGTSTFGSGSSNAILTSNGGYNLQLNVNDASGVPPSIVLDATTLDVQINEAFNVSSVGNVRMNGSLLIENDDDDGALNLTSGGAWINGSLYAIGASVMLEGSGGITFDDNGAGINVGDGANTANFQSRGDNNLKLLGSGGATLELFDDENGGHTVITPSGSGIFNFNNVFNITGTGGVTLSGDLSVDDSSDSSIVSSGGMELSDSFNVSSAGNLITNGTVTMNGGDQDGELNLTQGGAWITNDFFAGGIVTLNDDVVLKSATALDALNVSAGGAYLGGALTTAGGFNVSDAGNVKINGSMTIENSNDDALNVSAGGAIITGNIDVGSRTLTTDSEKTTVSINNLLRLVPRTDPPSSAQAGTIYFLSNISMPCYYNGTVWLTFNATRATESGACS
jgi:hypothetical protein